MELYTHDLVLGSAAHMADKARVHRPREGLVKLDAGGTQGVEGELLFSAECGFHPPGFSVKIFKLEDFFDNEHKISDAV